MGALRSMKRQAGKRQAQKEGTSTMGQVAGQVGAAGMEAEEAAKGPQDASPQGEQPTEAQVAESEAYQVMLMQLIHSPESREAVAGLLKTGEPALSLPKAALNLNRQAMAAWKNNRGENPSSGTLVAGVVYMIEDLIEIGNMVSGWNLNKEEVIVPLIQTTMKTYIHEGLKDGSLDAVELQKETEPLLNKAQQETGLQISQELQMPGAPTGKMGMDKIVKNSTDPLEKQNAELKGQLAQANNQGGRQPQAPAPQGQLQGGMA